MSVSTDRPGITARIAELIAASSEGSVPEAVAKVPGSLRDKGLTSLAYLTLIDRIETEFGVYIDLEDQASDLTSTEGLVTYVERSVISS